MKKIGICTVYTGFNYGSALQAFATKQFLKKHHYDGEILKLSGSIVAGRDIRLRKLITLASRFLFHFPHAIQAITTYTKSYSGSLSTHSKQCFESFYRQHIQPTYVSNHKLKKRAKSDEYAAFICGSDQIWNSSTYYIDPFYYLTFAPKHKRIAWAPSFGRDFIPPYNRKKIGRLIKNIPTLSIREKSGQQLISSLFHKNATLLPDPTLLLTEAEWKTLLDLTPYVSNQKYVLAYFLNEPSQEAKRKLEKFSKKGYQILSIPYQYHGEWFDRCISSGPIDFLELLLGAEFVFTDSFHGTAFSINFQKSFWVFDRQYGSASNQSPRIKSLLEQTHLLHRFNPSDEETCAPIDFNNSQMFLDAQRLKATKFILNAIQFTEKREEQ